MHCTRLSTCTFERHPGCGRPPCRPTVRLATALHPRWCARYLPPPWKPVAARLVPSILALESLFVTYGLATRTMHAKDGACRHNSLLLDGSQLVPRQNWCDPMTRQTVSVHRTHKHTPLLLLCRRPRLRLAIVLARGCRTLLLALGVLLFVRIHAQCNSPRRGISCLHQRRCTPCRPVHRHALLPHLAPCPDKASCTLKRLPPKGVNSKAPKRQQREMINYKAEADEHRGPTNRLPHKPVATSRCASASLVVTRARPDWPRNGGNTSSPPERALAPRALSNRLPQATTMSKKQNPSGVIWNCIALQRKARAHNDQMGPAPRTHFAQTSERPRARLRTGKARCRARPPPRHTPKELKPGATQPGMGSTDSSKLRIHLGRAQNNTRGCARPHREAGLDLAWAGIDPRIWLVLGSV